MCFCVITFFVIFGSIHHSKYWMHFFYCFKSVLVLQNFPFWRIPTKRFVAVLLKPIFRIHEATVCLIGFRATFATLFVINYWWLRKCSLSSVANRFELWCQSHAVDFIVLQHLSLLCKRRMERTFMPSSCASLQINLACVRDHLEHRLN